MARDKHCLDLLASLSDYVDGDLPQGLCDEIEKHMSECENCRIVVDTLRKTVYLYRSDSPAETVPEDVRRRLYHRLDLDEYL
jgi:anti-sigma factor (TIGR02949 family)